MIAVLLGLLVGLRHAFEPDHLTAVGTLVADQPGARRGALLGAIWGLGHTISLVAVGALLAIVGTTLPERAAIGFELCVSAMLLVLGVRSLVVAFRDGATAHHAAGHGHPHAPSTIPHVHVGARTLAWRPLVVGLVHGLAGSGALTAVVFADLPTVTSRIVYIALFGLGSIAGMAVASGAAGVWLAFAARSPRARRGIGYATGVLSIVVGIVWAIPLVGAVA